MSKTYELDVCDMIDHELGNNDQPEFLGDNSQTIVLQGICKRCGVDVYISHLGMHTEYELSVNGRIIHTEHN